MERRCIRGMTLQKNPILGDRAAIKRLNREQRALVQIVNVFNRIPQRHQLRLLIPHLSRPSHPAQLPHRFHRSLDLERLLNALAEFLLSAKIQD